MAESFKVRKSERGARLDNFVYSRLGDWSHKRVKKLIDDKKVSVNGKVVFISAWHLKPNDLVVVKASANDQKIEEKSRYNFVQVLHEDEEILVTVKPPFVDYDSFVADVNAFIKRKKGKQFHPYLGQMHRLDKETSGILLFTKKKQANVLADQFRERTIRKIYLAVVRGRIKDETGSITANLEKKKFDGGKKVRVVKKGEGKESKTLYRVLERYENATLAEVQLATGRTHQIRVHMASIGHPLVGDKIYGEEAEVVLSLDAGKKKKDDKKKGPPIKRQALHAFKIEFKHPITNERLQFTAPPPKDFDDLVDYLREGGTL